MAGRQAGLQRCNGLCSENYTHETFRTHVEFEYCKKPNSSRCPSGHRDCITGKMPAEVRGAAV